jgi:HPt (histidine-containing phosphotransfer) domain-containing protein
MDDSGIEQRLAPAVMRAFLKHIPNELDSISAALTDNDAPRLKQAAHRLKGSSLALGIPRMAALCLELESAPPNGAALLTQLADECRRIGLRFELHLATLARED